MKDPTLQWSGVDQSANDYGMFDDYPDDDLMMCSAEPGQVHGHTGIATLFESSDVLVVNARVGIIIASEPKVEAPFVRLAKPPRIWWCEVLRRIMSAKRYRAEVETEIIEMREEYYECIARGNEREAALVVIRWNIAVIPRWVWGHVWVWAWQLIDWFKG